MKSSSDEGRNGSGRLGGVALRLVGLLFVFAASIAGQSVAASISTIVRPTSNRPFFDSSGNTYYLSLSGKSTAGAAQTQPGGGTCSGVTSLGIPISLPCPDAAVMKVDPTGNEVWGTLLGGPTADTGTALAVDSNGNVVLTGSTGGQFPTTPGAAIQSSTTATAFAAKVSSDGSKFLYSTYLPDSVAATSVIAVDAASNAYIAGTTTAGDAFVLKLSADGSTINYNVTLGGSGADAATAITVDPAGNAFVTGQTTSPDFPVTAGALQQQLKGSQNGFLVKLSPSGSVLASTYFGGSGSDSPSSIAVDGAGNIDLAGYTTSLDLPATQGVMQPSAIVPPWNNFAPAGFVAQFSPNGILLNWASYVTSSDVRPSGSSFDVGVSALGVGQAGDIYIGGRTGPGFPVTSSAPEVCFQGTTNLTNGFLAHLSSNGALMDATYLGDNAGGDVIFFGGLMPFPDGTVLIAWRDSPIGVVSKPDIGAVYQPDAQGNVPTQLAGVQVRFDGVPVPVLYAQSRQINAIAPAGLTLNGTTQVLVTYNNQQFGPVVAATNFGSPGIFRLRIGQSAQAVAINQDGTLNGPTNPAAPGSVVAVWGTGFGQTNPPCPIGGLNAPDAAPLSAGMSALIYGVLSFGSDLVVKSTPVQYVGSAPTLVCGVEQINFQVPVNQAPGTFSFLPWIQLVDGNSTSVNEPQIGATIAVK